MTSAGSGNVEVTAAEDGKSEVARGAVGPRKAKEGV